MPNKKESWSPTETLWRASGQASAPLPDGLEECMSASETRLTAALRQYVDQQVETIVEPLRRQLEEVTGERDSLAEELEDERRESRELSQLLSSIIETARCDVPELYAMLPEEVREFPEREMCS